jgi:hypothetical protein
MLNQSIGKKIRTESVAPLRDGIEQKSQEICCKIRFRANLGSELHMNPDIDDEKDLDRSLLLVATDEHFIRLRRCSPINLPRIIAREILTELAKLNTRTMEYRTIRPREESGYLFRSSDRESLSHGKKKGFFPL